MRQNSSHGADEVVSENSKDLHPLHLLHELVVGVLRSNARELMCKHDPFVSMHKFAIQVVAVFSRGHGRKDHTSYTEAASLA